MSNFPDMVTHMGGVPVSSTDFAGWWGNDVFFVDYDNGVRQTNRGKNDMDNPQKDIYRSIQDAGPGDTIYVRPRTTVATVGSNNTVITPAASEAANWTIPRTAHHLSIIGTSVGGGITAGVNFQSYAALTTSTIQVLAPYVTFENVGFKGISAQVAHGLLEVQAQTPGTHDGFACVVNNCDFQIYQSSNGGAISFDSGRYNRALNSHFWHCRSAIELASTYKTVQGNEVKGCTFRGATTDIDVDILIADANHVLIDECLFDHALPAHASGSRLLYVQVVGAAANGVMSNCTFADTVLTMDTMCSLSSIVDVACKSAADTVWCTTT